MDAEVRVAVVEDQPLFRNMLVSLLGSQPGLLVVAQAAGAAEARRLITPGSVDVVLLDVELAGGNGVGLGVSLRRADPDIGILLLSGQDVMELLLDLPEDVRRGWSYLSKTSSTSADVLLRTIAATARGETVLDSSLVERSRPRAGSSLSALSQRQYEVLALVARGLSNGGVADHLGISARSVENHLSVIYSTLTVDEGANARVGAVLRFIEESSRWPS